MKYLFFITYVLVIIQWCTNRKILNQNSNIRGRNYYKIAGIINMILGFCGMLVINTFIRDTEIVPQIYVYIGLFGFFFLVLYGIYCIFKMMASSEP